MNFMQRFWRLKTDPMSTSATYSFLNRSCGTHTATRYQPSRAILIWVKTPDGALARQTGKMPQNPQLLALPDAS